jgi:hypothetical protein
MANASSTIRVAIIGDVKGLSKALGQGEKEVGAFGGKVKGLVAGIGFAVAARELTDFAGDALAEADRVGDATARLELQIGDLAGPLNDAADGFSNLGQSRQDILELEASFADTATALGLANPLIADFADDVAATAAAVELLGGADAATNVDLIGKAAGGSQRAMRELGVFVSEAAVAQQALKDTGKELPEQLTDTELAAARLKLIMEQLKPKLDEVALGSGDVEQKQADLQARFETLTGKIGEGIEGPLTDFLGWVLAGIDGLERMDEVMDIVSEAFDTALDHVKPLTDALGELASLLFSIGTHGLVDIGDLTGGSNKSAGAASVDIFVNALSNKATEQAVVDALRNAAARSGELQ